MSDYLLREGLTKSKAIVIARRATFDPGVFTPRLFDHNGLEELHRWQARAVVIALGSNGPAYDHKWSNFAQAVQDVTEEELTTVRDPRPAPKATT